MRNRVHKMGFAQTNATIQEQRVEGDRPGFGHALCGSMGQFVGFTDHEIVECIAPFQRGAFQNGRGFLGLDPRLDHRRSRGPHKKIPAASTRHGHCASAPRFCRDSCASPNRQQNATARSAAQRRFPHRPVQGVLSSFYSCSRPAPAVVPWKLLTTAVQSSTPTRYSCFIRLIRQFLDGPHP